MAKLEKAPVATSRVNAFISMLPVLLSAGVDLVSAVIVAMVGAFILTM